jgi:hypothetical protein
MKQIPFLVCDGKGDFSKGSGLTLKQFHEIQSGCTGINAIKYGIAACPSIIFSYIHKIYDVEAHDRLGAGVCSQDVH